MRCGLANGPIHHGNKRAMDGVNLDFKVETDP